MKKLLLSCFALAATSLAFASQVVIPLNAETGFTGDKNGYTATVSGFEISYLKGSGKDCVEPSADHIRVYQYAEFKVVAKTAGVSITEIEIEGIKSYTGALNPSTGTGAWKSTTYTWNGEASEVDFTTAAQVRMKSISITYVAPGEVVVSAPVISPDEGTYTSAQTVTITAGAGLSIYYTTDGTKPTDESTLYTEAFTVSESCTVKAIAVDSDDNTSSVASATYKIVSLLEGAAGDGTETSPYNPAGAYNASLLGSTDMVYVSGTVSKIEKFVESYGEINYYISADGTTDNQLYIYNGFGLGGEKFTAETDLKVGDKVIVKGNLSSYNDAPQIGRGSIIVSLNGEVPPTLELVGDGTETNPFTVTDVLAINNNSDYISGNDWVKGYIVGYAENNSINNAHFTAEGCEVMANILIAAAADCEDVAECVPVQLTNGTAIRDALNLKENPGNLGKLLLVQGSLEAYFGCAGVKNLKDYKIETSAIGVIEAENADAPVVYYNLQGQRVNNPANGLFIMRQGSKTAKVVR